MNPPIDVEFILPAERPYRLVAAPSVKTQADLDREVADAAAEFSTAFLHQVNGDRMFKLLLQPKVAYLAGVLAGKAHQSGRAVGGFPPVAAAESEVVK